jgi:pyroglutamyl-peptidase
MASPETRVLVTGFEAFGPHDENPTQIVVQALHGWGDLATVVLPCDFRRALPALEAAIDGCGPQLVVCLGFAARRTEVSVERVALNLIDARIADNAGHRPVDEPVLAGGPPAYFSTLPVKAIAQALNDAAIPAAVSLSAGSFVCNQVFYGLAHRIAQGRGPRQGGFIHLPPFAVLPLQDQLAAVRIVIDASSRRP